MAKDSTRFNTIKKYMEEPKPSKPRHQMDWIYSSAKGNLHCISICSRDGKDYYLKEWVNFSDLSSEKLKEMMDMGYMTMLEAMKQVPTYQYFIGNHSGKKPENNEYFKTLLGDKIKGKHELNTRIDKEDFEKEISKMGHKTKHKGHDRPPSTPFG